MLKILHTGDLHTKDDAIKEAKKCFKKIEETAASEQVDLIVLAGDTFDSQYVRMDSESARLIFDFVTHLADIADVCIVEGTPTHEGRAVETLKHIWASHSVWVFDRPEQIHVCKQGGEKGFSHVITLIPTPTKQHFQTSNDIKISDKEIANEMSAIFAGYGASAEKGIPHILVGHWNTTGAYISGTQMLTGVDIEISKDQMAMAKPTVVCLGHIHRAQQLGDNIFYCGSVYRTNIGEIEPKGFYIHEIEDCQLIKSRFIETPATFYIVVDIDLTKDGTTIESELDKVPLPSGEISWLDSVVILKINVFQDEVSKINQSALIDFFTKDTYHAKSVDIRVTRVPRAVVRAAEILKKKTLGEKIIEMERLNGRKVPESVFIKTRRLENEAADKIISSLT